MKQTDLIPPTEDSGDAAHAVARMLINQVPIVGGTAVEVFNLVVTPPIQKRLERWRESVAIALMDLIRRCDDY